jgi:hypothetical protein
VKFSGYELYIYLSGTTYLLQALFCPLFFSTCLPVFLFFYAKVFCLFLFLPALAASGFPFASKLGAAGSGRDEGANSLQAVQPRLRAKRAPIFWGAFWGARRCGYATETAS